MYLMMEGDSILYLDVCVSETDYENGARQILQHIRPTWKSDDIQFKAFDEGFTNKMMGCYVRKDEGSDSNSSSHSDREDQVCACDNGDTVRGDEEEEEDMILIRVSSESMDNIVNRKEERENFRLLSQAGLAPPIYCVFGNGMAYGFFPGVTLDAKTVREPHIQKLIAEEMVKLHRMSGPYRNGKPQCELRVRAQALLDQLPVDSQQYSLRPSRLIAEEMVKLHRMSGPYRNGKPQCELRARTQALLDQVPADRRFPDSIPSKSELQLELGALMDELDSLEMDVVFSHNDPLNKNIIYNHRQGTVRFIDYEYAFYNYEAFDIGDHFSEYPGMDVVDYTLYPSKEEQLPWLQHYLQYKAEAAGKSKVDVTANDIERLYVQVNKCACAAHFYWGMWSLIQADHSDIDYDYIGFANTRFTEYFTRKKEFFPLKLPA